MPHADAIPVQQYTSRRAGIMLSDMLRDLDDTALMLRYRDDGDMIAFELLYSRHRGPLYRYLLRQCGDPDAADDLFQEVWARIIKARANYRPMAKFTTYLYHLAHNCAVDRIRRLVRRPQDQNWAIDTEQQPDERSLRPDEQAQLDSDASRLRVALDDLAAEQRETFLLHEESGLTLEEIGRVMGVGRETAKSRLRYAVGHLRRLLDPSNAQLTGTET